MGRRIAQWCVCTFACISLLMNDIWMWLGLSILIIKDMHLLLNSWTNILGYRVSTTWKQRNSRNLDSQAGCCTSFHNFSSLWDVDHLGVFLAHWTISKHISITIWRNAASQVLVLRCARDLQPIVQPGFPLFQLVWRTLQSFNAWGSSYVHRSCPAWDSCSFRISFYRIGMSWETLLQGVPKKDRFFLGLAKSA